MQKLHACRAAFRALLRIRGGVFGQRIPFEKEPSPDVGLRLFLKGGRRIRI